MYGQLANQHPEMPPHLPPPDPQVSRLAAMAHCKLSMPDRHLSMHAIARIPAELQPKGSDIHLQVLGQSAYTSLMLCSANVPEEFNQIKPCSSLLGNPRQ